MGVIGQKAWNKGLHVGSGSCTSFKKGQIPWNLGLRKRVKITCKTCGKIFEDFPSGISDKKKWGIRKYCSLKCYQKTYNFGIRGRLAQEKMNRPTSIEKKVYETLKEMGLLFETQKLINGKFIVDAYLPDFNLIIEADGEYWHGIDKTVKKDKAENAYLTKCGYKLLRLTEKEIMNNMITNKIEGMVN